MLKEGIKALNHGQRDCGSNARRGKTLLKKINKCWACTTNAYMEIDKVKEKEFFPAIDTGRLLAQQTVGYWHNKQF